MRHAGWLLVALALPSLVSGAGHLSYLDRPDQFHQALLEFLSSLEASS